MFLPHTSLYLDSSYSSTTYSFIYFFGSSQPRRYSLGLVIDPSRKKKLSSVIFISVFAIIDHIGSLFAHRFVSNSVNQCYQLIAIGSDCGNLLHNRVAFRFWSSQTFLFVCPVGFIQWRFNREPYGFRQIL